MHTYNVIVIDKDGLQQQLGIAAKNWQAAINAAKSKAGLDADPSTDENLMIVQKTGDLHVVAK